MTAHHDMCFDVLCDVLCLSAYLAYICCHGAAQQTPFHRLGSPTTLPVSPTRSKAYLRTVAQIRRMMVAPPLKRCTQGPRGSESSTVMTD